MMKNIKTISFLVLAIAFVFAAPTKSFALSCTSSGGPIGFNDWLDHQTWCNNGSSDNGDDDNNNNSNGDLNVSTLSATNIDSDSATLRGEITDLDSSDDYVRFFEWGTSSSNLSHTVTISGTTDDEGTFSRTITGLQEDETYYFRACAENDDNSSDDDCGSTHSFTTDDDNGSNSSDFGDGSILTTDASSVTATSAVINGVVTNDSGSQTVWFEYGPTTNLGFTTASRTVSAHQSIVSTTISGLIPGHAYFFRLISNNGDHGDYKAFVTNSATVVSHGGTTTTTTTTNNNSNNSGSNSNEGEDENTGEVVFETIQYLHVGLVSSVKEIRPGETASFAAVYENVSDKELKNIIITVDFPAGMTPTDIGPAKTLSAQKIEVMIPTLPAFTKGSITLAAEVGEKVANDSFLVTVIGATFDHPAQTNTRIETLNSSIIRVSNTAVSTKNNNQGASVAGAGGSFFPTTFLGWFVLATAIGVLVYLSRKLYKEREEAKKKKEEQNKVLHGELKIAR
jgi:hypothetical protein